MKHLPCYQYEDLSQWFYFVAKMNFVADFEIGFDCDDYGNLIWIVRNLKEKTI